MKKRCGMCSSCKSMPPWAPERLAKMDPEKRSKVVRSVEDLMNRREKFLNIPEPEGTQTHITDQELLEGDHTQRSTEDPVLPPATQKAETIDQREKANSSESVSVPIEPSTPCAGAEIKADRLSVEKPQVLVSTTAMNEDRVMGVQTSGFDHERELDFQDAVSKLADDTQGHASNLDSPSTQNENIMEEISLVNRDRSHKVAQEPVIDAVTASPDRLLSQVSEAPSEGLDARDESGLLMKQAMLEDDDMKTAEPEKLTVDSRDVDEGRKLGDDDVLDEPAAQLAESDEVDQDLPLDSTPKPDAQQESRGDSSSSIADPVQTPLTIQDQQTTPVDSPAPFSTEENTTV
uniref:Uncharacterized protein n=1 Tax=Rhodosorus marinus TaxID=101924 RepID=A0A7S0G5A3_9RHOD|mmetsp:Transcript_20594/g.29860  ORF Transcript_20594/g.29860 Transcript_20594/m.29860 type:complete len:347 (+) Transcript_20594:270-1310(+)